MKAIGIMIAAVIAVASLSSPASAKVLCGGFSTSGKMLPACSNKPAKKIGKAPKKCPSGSVFNLKTWGCWKKCPSDYKRTLNRVDGDKACIRRKASTKPKHKRTSRVSNIFCPKKQNQFFHLVDGGTCWSCPKLYRRNSFKKIKGSKACESIGIDWQTPYYREPGLFALQGTAGIVVDILKNHRSKIDKLITNRKVQLKSQLGLSATSGFTKKQWQIIRDTPQESPEILYMVFMRMLAHAIHKGQVPTADKQLIAAFQTYVKRRRTHMAQDALNMYHAWKRADDYKRSQKQTTNSAGMASLFDYGTVPHDFGKVASDGLQRQGMSGAAAAGMIASSVGSVGLASVPVAKSLVDVAAMARTLDKLRGAGKAAVKGLKALKTGLSTAKGFTSAAGPLVIVSAAAVLAEISIANLIKIKEAEKKLKTSLSAAKKSVSLKTMVNAGQIDNLSLYWGLATKRSGLKAPSAVLAAAKQAYAAKGYK